MNRILRLLICIAFPLIVGGVSGFFTVQGVKDWYLTLAKPNFTPPNYLFGPVWTFLYAFMGVAFFRILEKGKSVQKIKAIRIYLWQLFFNFCWSFLFFSQHQIGLAFIDILILWVLILIMIIRFKKLDAFAGYSQIPYLLWVSFATALTAAIFILNW
jgi:tryptophan-rich sensory protein